eukprot:365313-Chlamydomonas_euryale.AAC.5
MNTLTELQGCEHSLARTTTHACTSVPAAVQRRVSETHLGTHDISWPEAVDHNNTVNFRGAYVLESGDTA